MSKAPPVTSVLMSVCIGLALPAWAEAPRNAEGGNQLVFSIPIGPNDVRYADEGVEELIPWGPAAFTVAKDGSFWVTDSVGNRLVRYSSRGDRLQAYSLDELVIGALDVKVRDNEMVVLGEHEFAPSIVRLNGLGRLVERYQLSREEQHRGLTGIELAERGEVLAVREGGAGLSRIHPGATRSTLVDLPEMVRNGKRFSARGGDLKATSRQGYSLGYVQAGDTQVTVEVPNFLGGLRVLSANPDGSFYVVVEEVAFSPAAIRVDQTVRHYGADGAMLGVARVPIAERYTAVENGLAVGRRGEVYALVTRPRGVDVQRLTFQSRLPAILPETSVQFGVAEEPTFGITCSRTRDAVVNDANAYLNLSTYLSSTNTDGYCAGRRKPRYIGGAGTYPSMPYKWGGWDTGAMYKDGMAAGRQAGDICGDGTCDSDPVLSCARGMDCSGFITRVWRRTDKKYGTSTLSEISHTISKSNMLAGDILNKAGSHVVLFHKTTSTGLYIWEETKTSSWDRVVYRHTSWSTWDLYTARRYNEIC
jgi:streptogramin lyase